MKDNEIDLEEIIKVETMPKIFSQLEMIGRKIDDATKDIVNMVCNEDNKKEVKKRKQDITKLKKIMEDRRVQIKKQILEPYNLFEEKYKNEILEKIENAEETLSNKYKKIEIKQLEEKKDLLKKFVEEHCKANNVHIDFEKIGLNITLSASEKSLKEQAKSFIEKVASELKLIELEEFHSEILYEYNKTLDYIDAKTKVIERHKHLEIIEKEQKEKQILEKQEQQVIENAEEAIEITAPVEIVEELENTPSIYQFEVKATTEQIKKIVEFMKELGVEYK